MQARLSFCKNVADLMEEVQEVSINSYMSQKNSTFISSTSYSMWRSHQSLYDNKKDHWWSRWRWLPDISIYSIQDRVLHQALCLYEHYFSVREINPCYRMPADVVLSFSTDSFKTRLAHFVSGSSPTLLFSSNKFTQHASYLNTIGRLDYLVIKLTLAALLTSIILARPA